MAVTEIVNVLDAHAALGEAPVWCPREQVLYWLDICAPALHRFDPKTGADEVFPSPTALHKWDQPVGSFALRERGGLVMACRDGFAFYDLDTGVSQSGDVTGLLRVINEVEADLPENRFNDGKCDRRGRFWAGSYNIPENPAGNLYRLDPDLTVHRMETGITCSNGLGWSLDDSIMYYADSNTYRIDAFDFDSETGAIENRRPFAEMGEKLGQPDGLTVDAEDFVWCVTEGYLARFDPDGGTEQVIEMPVPNPTSCIFGGEDLEVLYVTSARTFLTAAQIKEAPQSGDLFALEPGVRGLPEPRFAG